jgi:hypothetical protein
LKIELFDVWWEEMTKYLGKNVKPKPRKTNRPAVKCFLPLLSARPLEEGCFLAAAAGSVIGSKGSGSMESKLATTIITT